MPVDFVQTGGNNQSKGGKYDIEYTNPQADQPSTPPKRGNLLGGFFQKKGTAPAMPKSGTEQAAPSTQSAVVPDTKISKAAAYKPVAPVVAQPTAVHKPAVVAPTSGVTYTERHLPPPPPPPSHSATPQVSPRTVPTPPVKAAHELPQQKVQSPTPPPPPAKPVAAQPVAPVTRNPMRPPVIAATPAAAAAPAGLASTGQTTAPAHRTNVGEVVAQNVSSIRGETTHPEPMHATTVGVNLLPSALSQPLRQLTPLYRLLRLSVVTTMLLTVLYLGMVGFQAFYVWQAQSKLTEIAALDTQIMEYRGLQADINQTSDTLEAIDGLLNRHIYWTQWFNYLEKHTLPTVYYSAFTGSANGTMNLNAVAPDFETVSAQLAVWQHLPEVTTVSVTTATRGATTEVEGETTTGVQFNISLQVDPAILHYE